MNQEFALVKHKGQFFNREFLWIVLIILLFVGTTTGGKQVPGSFLLNVDDSLSYFFPGLPILESIVVLLR